MQMFFVVSRLGFQAEYSISVDSVDAHREVSI